MLTATRLVFLALLFYFTQGLLQYGNIRARSRGHTHLSTSSRPSNLESSSVPVRPGEGEKNGLVNIAGTGARLLGAVAGTSTIIQFAAPAAASPGKKIVVLGSGGKTGKQIVTNLAKNGFTVQPTVYALSKSNSYENVANVNAPVVADVTKIETLEESLAGAAAVIFAASASKKGGNAQKVDYVGVENVAKECIRLKVPRLVVISSGAITRPDSLGFKFTNIFGGIMDFKLKGEDALRAAYDASGDSSLSYIIIRPGGLLDNSPRGATEMELNQGDTISGEVNRADVAECAAAAAVSTTIPPNVTFEVYEKGTSGPLEGKFSTVSGYERTGQTYDEMFKGLKSNYNKA